MLVLTRKLNERIVIGENIRITVVGIRGNHVRLGIDAPPEVTILRDELQRHGAAPSEDPASHDPTAAERESRDPAIGQGRVVHLAAAAGYVH